MHVYQDFSKADKKQLRSLIEVAVQRTIKKFAEETFPMHKALVETEHEDIRVPFWEMHERFRQFSKEITNTYDNYSHRDIQLILASAIIDNNLTKEDLNGFSTEGLQKMDEIINVMIRIRS